ncbi:MAG: phosphotransferase family protein [Steroidobacteraceae bacterium]
MLPDESRLLTGARDLVREMSGAGPATFQGKLDVLDTLLSELQLRADTAFYVRHFSEGLRLAETGAAYAGLPTMAGTLPPALDPALATETMWQHIESLRRCLEEIVRVLGPRERAARDSISPYLQQVVDWENRFYARHHASPSAAVEAPDPYTSENLQRYFRGKFPEWTNLEVTGIRVLVGGFSKRTVMVDLRDDVHGTRSIVMRVELPSQFRFWEGDQIDNEFPILQLMLEKGMPIAKPLWLETDKRHIGFRFLVSEKGVGENVGNHLGLRGGASQELVDDVIQWLVRLHDTRVDPNDPCVQHTYLDRWAHHKTLTESVAARIEYWIEHLRQRQVRPSPLTIRIIEWLRDNVPVCDERPVPVHGDFGLHNMLVTGDRVTCILDWEYLVFGDPAEDLVPFFFHMAAMMSREEILARYEKLGGRRIDEYRLRYFDVVYRLKYVLTCENALRMFAQHTEADPGLCQLGFKYAYAGLASVNEKIAQAEAAKSSR